LNVANNHKRAPSSVRIAIVGQPNSGKSSFLNKVVKENRAVVSEVAGTTHDPVDHTLEWAGEQVTLIDTAGITRQAKLKMGTLERSTVLWSFKVIERAHVVILLIDPIKGITSQDQTIANYVLENFKSGKNLVFRGFLM
jgi:GTP-binding protein